MKHPPILLVVLCFLVLDASLVVAVIDGRRLSRGRVYSVAAVQAALAEDPRAWVGRTVWVRGQATACYITLMHGYFRCLPAQPRLNQPGALSTEEPLYLAWGPPDPLLAVARRVPLLGGLLPAPQDLAWQQVATYRVRLRAMAGSQCGVATCYEALLLDAAR